MLQSLAVSPTRTWKSNQQSVFVDGDVLDEDAAVAGGPQKADAAAKMLPSPVLNLGLIAVSCGAHCRGNPEAPSAQMESAGISCADCCSRPRSRLPETKPLMNNFVMVTFIVRWPSPSKCKVNSLPLIYESEPHLNIPCNSEIAWSSRYSPRKPST